MAKDLERRCGEMITQNGDHHFCGRPPGHVGDHTCPCRFSWRQERTYSPSEASLAWRATKPLIKDQMPQLGTAMPDGGGWVQTTEEALEDLDNEILWYAQELEALRTFRAAVMEETVDTTFINTRRRN